MRYTFMSDDYAAVKNKVCYEDQNEDYCGAAIDKLADYEDAEEQGLLVRLPCKDIFVGGTFYYIAGTSRGNEYIASDTVASIEISDAKLQIIDSCECCHVEFWFTREEAEVALAALKGEIKDV